MGLVGPHWAGARSCGGTGVCSTAVLPRTSPGHGALCGTAYGCGADEAVLNPWDV